MYLLKKYMVIVIIVYIYLLITPYNIDDVNVIHIVNTINNTDNTLKAVNNNTYKPFNFIYTHNDNKLLNIEDTIYTIEAIIKELPNIEFNTDLVKLVFETMIIESKLGTIDLYKAARRYNNYGVVQFRIDTAKYLLKHLRNTQNDVYKKVMSYYNSNLSLKDNLLSNVPFSIAMCIQYYNLKLKNKKINTIANRGRVWKLLYNTKKGKGTTSKYITRINKFYKEYSI